MAEKTTSTTKKISVTSTKQEMLEAYNLLSDQLKEKKSGELKPEEEISKKRSKEIVEVADTLSLEGVMSGISNLRLETGKMLNQLSERLEGEVVKYRKVRDAIEVKEEELKEIYEIEKSTQTLLALIETQSFKRKEFETEMNIKQQELERQIQTLQTEQDRRKKDYEIELKERDAFEKRTRQREKEEYEYVLKRDQQLSKDKFEDGITKQTREVQDKRETLEKQLQERENRIKGKEEEFSELQKRAASFPKEIESIVQKTVKETAEKVQAEARNKEELFKKTFEGERNVLAAKIESLESITKEQKEQILRLSAQLEKAYQKVEDIAVKSVGSFSDVKTLLGPQQWINEHSKKQLQEK